MIDEQELNGDDALLQVEKFRALGSKEQLAGVLETLAAVSLREFNIERTAAALEEAAEIWFELADSQRQGSCLLLAASSLRVAGDLEGAQRNLDRGLSANLPKKLKDGFEVERCEQELASGCWEAAYQGFTQLMLQLTELEPLQKAQLLQRRAAAALVGSNWRENAEDLLASSTIYSQQGLHADSEASALAAAISMAEFDAQAAERVWTEISQTIPVDGAAATRRGLTGGKIALQAGSAAEALRRFDQARQGALDVGDPTSYWAAAFEAAQAAEALDDLETAYSRLATAWVTLADILGPELAAEMVRPILQDLRDRLGKDKFCSVKQRYEEKRSCAQKTRSSTR